MGKDSEPCSCCRAALCPLTRSALLSVLPVPVTSFSVKLFSGQPGNRNNYLSFKNGICPVSSSTTKGSIYGFGFWFFVCLFVLFVFFPVNIISLIPVQALMEIRNFGLCGTLWSSVSKHIDVKRTVIYDNYTRQISNLERSGCLYFVNFFWILVLIWIFLFFLKALKNP